MSDLTASIASYSGCILIGLSIGFLELLRVKILSYLPTSGSCIYLDSPPGESHARTNSYFLIILLCGLLFMSGLASSEGPTAPIQWHWSKLPITAIAIIIGEYARLKLFDYMTETAPPAPRTIITKADFNESLDAKHRADFHSSDYARQYSSYEAYKESLKPQ